MGAAALMVSCSQEEVLQLTSDNGNYNEISFRVRSSKIARSQEHSTANLKAFNVFGFNGWPEDNYEAGEEMTDFFDGGLPVLFSNNGSGLFTSTPTYYYPTDGSWVYFAAYAPTSLNMETLPYGGLTIKNFTVDPDITKQLDIICDNGGSNLELGSDDEDIEFTFKHALTKIYVSRIINQDTRYKYEIAGIKLGNISNSGEFIYRGEKSLTADEDTPNGVVGEDGYVNDPIGDGFYWKANEQKDDMVYLFDEPLVLDEETDVVYPMTGNDTGEEDVIGNADGAGKGGFMLIPQKLSSKFVDEDGTLEGQQFGEGMSYIAFLVRITYTDNGNVVYPYAEGVEDITEEIGGVTYAWAAFPVSSLWRPGTYVDYAITLSNGAGYVAPGAAEGVAFRPILSRQIQFTEEVQFWPDYNEVSIDQDNELEGDGGNFDDPFGE